MTERLIQLHVEDPNEAVMLLGNSDQNMKLIEEELGLSIMTRGDSITLNGDVENQEMGRALIEQLIKVIRKGININQRDVATAIEMVKGGTIEYFSELYDEEISQRKWKSNSCKDDWTTRIYSSHSYKRFSVLYRASRNWENISRSGIGCSCNEVRFCKTYYINTTSC